MTVLRKDSSARQFSLGIKTTLFSRRTSKIESRKSVQWRTRKILFIPTTGVCNYACIPSRSGIIALGWWTLSSIKYGKRLAVANKREESHAPQILDVWNKTHRHDYLILRNELSHIHAWINCRSRKKDSTTDDEFRRLGEIRRSLAPLKC